MRKKAFKVLAVALVALATSSLAATAQQEEHPSWIMDTSGVGQDNNGVVRSEQILELGTAPSDGLQLEGENLMRRGNLDKALTAFQKSVELSPEDMDKRFLYATALEKKLMSMPHKDPELYNFLLKQWYFIFKKAEFIDQTLQAKEHLYHLCGTVPKTFERDKTFLQRVLIPEDKISKIQAAQSQMRKTQ